MCKTLASRVRKQLRLTYMQLFDQINDMSLYILIELIYFGRRLFLVGSLHCRELFLSEEAHAGFQCKD